MNNIFLIIVFLLTGLMQAQNKDTKPPKIISKIKMGATYSLPNSNVSITFKEVISDSRCPQDVTCVWAGEVTFLVLINNTTGPYEKTVTLGNSFELTQVNNYTVKAIGMYPIPKVNTKIPPQAYELWIQMEEITSNNNE